jgi:predicted permease
MSPAVNSPVAMFIIGAQMAQVSLHRIAGPVSFSLAVARRLLAVPLIMLLGLMLSRSTGCWRSPS